MALGENRRYRSESGERSLVLTETDAQTDRPYKGLHEEIDNEEVC